MPAPATPAPANPAPCGPGLPRCGRGRLRRGDRRFCRGRRLPGEGRDLRRRRGGERECAAESRRAQRPGRAGGDAGADRPLIHSTGPGNRRHAGPGPCARGALPVRGALRARSAPRIGAGPPTRNALRAGACPPVVTGARRGEQPAGGGGVGPRRRIPLHQRGDHRLQRPGRLRRGRVAVHDVGQHGHRTALALERAAPLDGRVQGGPERPQVRGGAGGLAPDTLRGAKPWRAHDHARLGQPGVAVQGGDAEVGQHGPAVGSNQDVPRLHVAVHHARRMRAAQRLEQRHAHHRGARRRQWPVLGQHLGQRPGRHQFHDDPRSALGLDHVVHGDHAGMAQPGRDPCLPQRPLPQHVPVLVRHGPGDPDLLDRDLAIEAQIPRPPHGAHGPMPDGVQQFIAPGDHASRPGH